MDCAAEFVKIADDFGLPTTSNDIHPEYFGPYVNSAGHNFLSFDPRLCRWKVLPLGPARNPISYQGDLSEEQFEHLNAAINMAKLMTPPPFDMAPDETVCHEHFVYEGWVLAWFFFPALLRWELGVVGRVDEYNSAVPIKVGRA